MGPRHICIQINFFFVGGGGLSSKGEAYYGASK